LQVGTHFRFSAAQIVRQEMEHKAEHNDCRMRGPDPDLEGPRPTVSP